jgi:hypothetical protein
MNDYQNYQTAYIVPKTIDPTVQIGNGLPKIKSHIKIGNLIIHNTHRFNWFHRKMWKLFFGFEIENIKENINE